MFIVNSNFGASTTTISDLKLNFVARAGSTSVRFVDPSIVNAGQCESKAGTPVAPLYEYANEMIMDLSVQSNYVLCAKFGVDWILFNNVRAFVKSVSDISPKVFVAGNKYQITLTGANLDVEDKVLFTATNCESMSAIAAEHTDATVVEATFPTSIGGAVFMCYDGVKLPIELSVVETTVSMTSSSEVYANSKVFFSGPAVTVNDQVKLVPAGSSCNASAVATYDMQMDAESSLYYMQLSLADEEAQYKACYLFNGEILSPNEFDLTVHSVKLTPSQLFYNVQMQLSVESGQSLEDSELVLCDESAVCLSVPVFENKTIRVTVPSTMKERLTVSVKKGETVMETPTVLTVAMATVSSVTPSVAFIGVATTFTFAGEGLGVGTSPDRVVFTTMDSCDSENLEDSVEIVEMTATNTFQAAAEKVHLCVSLSSGPFMMMASTISVYGLTSIQPTSVPAYKSVEFSLEGVGIQDGDLLVFVAAGEACDREEARVGTSVVLQNMKTTVTLMGAIDKVDVCYSSVTSSPSVLTKQPVLLTLYEDEETDTVTMEPIELIAFVNVEKRVLFSSLEIDNKISWTESGDCNDLVLNPPVRVNEQKEVRMEFSEGFELLQLCVCTNGVDFELQPNVTMTVISLSGVSVKDMLLSLPEEVRLSGTGVSLATNMFFVSGESARRLAADAACSNDRRVSTIASVVDGAGEITITKPVDSAMLCVAFEGLMPRSFPVSISVVYIDSMERVTLPVGASKSVTLPVHNLDPALVNVPAFLLNDNMELRSNTNVTATAEPEGLLEDIFTMDENNLMKFGEKQVNITIILPAVYDILSISLVAPSNGSYPQTMTVMKYDSLEVPTSVGTVVLSGASEETAAAEEYSLLLNTPFTSQVIMIQVESSSESDLLLRYVEMTVRPIVQQSVVYRAKAVVWRVVMPCAWTRRSM